MSARVQWTGLTEFESWLQLLPSEVEGDGTQIVVQIASDAEAEIEQRYPSRTGNLRRGVGLTSHANTGNIRAVIRSAAHHAHLYERGTKQRHTHRGWNRGVMHATPTVVPIAQRARQRMMAQLIGMLRDLHFEVTVG